MSNNHDNHDDSIHYDHEFQDPEMNSLRREVAKKISDTILKELENELDPKKTELMDFACGAGLISQALCPHVKSIIGVDIAQQSADEYNKGVNQQGINENKMKAICLDLKESEGDQLNGRKFDIIVSGSAYHHIDDFFAITRVLASYLKPSGTLLVLDLVKDPEHKFHKDHDVPHRNGIKSEEIEKAFLDTGILKDVKVESAFIFKKVMKVMGKDQEEYTFKYFIAKGQRKE